MSSPNAHEPNTPKYTFGRVFDAFGVYPASPRNANPAPTPVNISTANPAPTHASHAIQTVNVITINESSMTVRKSRMIQGRRVTSEELEYEMFPCGTRIEKRSRKFKFTYLIGATREASINARIHAEQTAFQEYNAMVFALTTGDVRKRVQGNKRKSRCHGRNARCHHYVPRTRRNPFGA